MKSKREIRGVDKYFIQSIIYLRALGTWPFQSRISLIFWRYFWIFQHISIMLPEGIKMYENRTKIDLLIESLPPFMYNIAVAMKFIGVVVNQKKIQKIIKKVEEDWNNLSDKKEIAILSYYAHLGNVFNAMYICLVYVVLLSYMFFPLSPIILDIVKPLNQSRPKNPLYMVEFYVDQDKYFYTILIHAYITSLAGIMPLCAFDTLLSNCVHHAGGMLKILGNRIQNIINENSLKEQSADDKYKEVVSCIIQHQKIIEYCDDLNNFVSTPFFFILSVCIIMMSVTGVVTVFKLEESFNDCIRFAMFTIAQIFHMFCYNFLGQNLLNFGETLNDCIYNSRWYAVSLKTKYLIKFILMRSLKPNKIQANIFPLTLINFRKILKVSMSYFTVLRSTA